jgi:hypothetical protein
VHPGGQESGCDAEHTDKHAPARAARRASEACHVQLCELAVKNFRAFGQALVRLPGQGLVLVAGANNSGKSSLLPGLDVGA